LPAGGIRQADAAEPAAGSAAAAAVEGGAHRKHEDPYQAIQRRADDRLALRIKRLSDELRGRDRASLDCSRDRDDSSRRQAEQRVPAIGDRGGVEVGRHRHALRHRVELVAIKQRNAADELHAALGERYSAKASSCRITVTMMASISSASARRQNPPRSNSTLSVKPATANP
jgi:hypothetical protein